ncbi:MAG: 50S ribosomal protein L29 [Myxococcota bacterium]|nr:50S ribosomal protein L29 [Myxococcales bacterium]
MKASELRGLSLDELEQKVKDQRKVFFDAKLRHVTGQLENTAQLKTLKREIARVETVLREKREGQQ